MRVLSLFDGMACGRVALERAEINIEKYYASEIDKYAIQISKKNYPDIIQLGDIEKWQEWDLSDIDLIIGGSPCQGFSFAGKQLNFDDPRSRLFFDYVEILRYYKPKYFLLENVKMKKEYQNVISEMLGVEPVEINSALVSAQNRKRLYWCNWPVEQPEDRGILLKDIIEPDAEPVTLTERRTGEAKKIRKEMRQQTGKDFSPRRAKELVFRTDGKSNCLTANLSDKEHLVGQKDKSQTILSTIHKENVKSMIKRGKTGLYVGVIKNHGVWKEKTDKSQCLDANYHKGVDNHGQRTMLTVNNGSYRKLTPLECERLQTLPDNYTEGVSNTQRYKMIGNGWTVDVVAHILRQLKNNRK